jgi:hypothetical protein
MAYAVIASLLLIAGAEAGGMVRHDARIDHPSGAVDARYHGAVTISQKQIGAVAPGGRSSTLGCAWQADITVTREALHSSGSRFTRSLERRAIVEGRRPGWCSIHRAAIAQEVASRREEFRDHLVRLAQEDEHQLRSELDAAHKGSRAG